MTFHVYSRDAFGGVTECHTAPTRWGCEKWLRDLQRAGRMTHFYVISTLDHARARQRYSTER
jgi:hypothetical protein